MLSTPITAIGVTVAAASTATAHSEVCDAMDTLVKGADVVDRPR